MNLSKFFIDRPIFAGVVSMLMPAKVMNAAYAAPLRRAAESLSIVALDDWSDRARGLFNADTFPLGITLAKRRTHDRVRITAGGQSFVLPQRALSVAGSEWSLVPPDVFEISYTVEAIIIVFLGGAGTLQNPAGLGRGGPVLDRRHRRLDVGRRQPAQRRRGGSVRHGRECTAGTGPLEPERLVS